MYRWAWLCPLGALALAAAAVVFFDLSLWSAVLVALLLVCPAIIAWGLIVTRNSKTSQPGDRRTPLPDRSGSPASAPDYQRRRP